MTMIMTVGAPAERNWAVGTSMLGIRNPNDDDGAGDQGLHQGEQRKHRPVLGEVPAEEDIVDGPVADRLGDRSGTST